MALDLFQLKLYALLRSTDTFSRKSLTQEINHIVGQLVCLRPDKEALDKWWTQQGTESKQAYGEELMAIAAASDRANLDYATIEQKLKKTNKNANLPETLQSERVHPISGQQRDLGSDTIPSLNPEEFPGFEAICQCPKAEAEKVFWWFWRFYPEMLAKALPEEGLIYPSHRILPDSPMQSYQATVSALTGARYPQPEEGLDSPTHPYLLVFTFSPIQEFIKSSRKFADFWAGSYLLHYLSVRLCWRVAEQYGPDAVIVPSLWGQDIVDALLLKHKYADFKAVFEEIQDGQRPVQRFIRRRSNNLSTAGFPNVITVLVPGQAAAVELGKQLSRELSDIWTKLGTTVRDDIRAKVGDWLDVALAEWQQGQEKHPDFNAARIKKTEVGKVLQELGINLDAEGDPLGTPDAIAHLQDMQRWCPQKRQADPHQHDPNRDQDKRLYPGWSWKDLWEYQLQNSWEPYWSAIPLGVPKQPLTASQATETYAPWKQAQGDLAQSLEAIPSEGEEQNYAGDFNVGTWWGSLQQRLRVGLQTVKNTRVWQIPAAPGVRSTVSGKFSALHPSFKYKAIAHQGEVRDLREGAGMPIASMRLFWLLMARAYPGLFNGSEMLNALEVTKRMAWVYGGAADFIGISTSKRKRFLRKRRSPKEAERVQGYEVEEREKLFYDRFVKFPNLSSVAAGRFMLEQPALVERYWTELQRAWDELQPKLGIRRSLENLIRRRPTHLLQVDDQLNPQRKHRQYYNGVMFSSKWLAEDLGLEKDAANELSGMIDSVHREIFQTTEGSPSDWWAVVLADGDSMGRYISGSKLKRYREYLNSTLTGLDESFQKQLPGFAELLKTRKRMGPATHVGLNRSLLDFSNRLVPYLTERRFCGRVIYSGGDDVMALMPLEDLPEYLLSLRAAWCGDADPYKDKEHRNKDPLVGFEDQQGYWQPQFKTQAARELVPDRPLFTMGQGATMSMGIVLAYKTIPLPTVLESLWEAEAKRAKKLPGKNGLCLRVLYGGGNQLEALMNGDLLQSWWACVEDCCDAGDQLSPVLYKLAELLPRRAIATENSYLFAEAAKVVNEGRDDKLNAFPRLETWLKAWEDWTRDCLKQHFEAEANWETAYLKVLKEPWKHDPLPLGCHPDDVGKLLRLMAFWVDKRVERYLWGHGGQAND